MNHPIKTILWVLLFTISSGLNSELIPCLGQRSDSAANPTGARLIPEDAFLALFYRPREVITSPAMELFPREVLTATGREGFGFDPCDIEQLVIVGAMEGGDGNDPTFAARLQLGEPFAPSETFLESTQGESWRDGTIYRHSRWGTFFVTNEKQVLFIGNETLIETMLDRPSDAGPIPQLIKSQPAVNHLDCYLAMDPIRDLLKSQLPPAYQFPGPLQPLLQLPDQIDSIVASANLEQDWANRILIQAVDEEAAEAIEQNLETGLGFARDLLMMQLEHTAIAEDKVFNDAMKRYINRLVDYAKQHGLPERQGDRLLTEFSNGINLAYSGVGIALLLPAVQSVRRAATRVDSANRLRSIAISLHNYHDRFKHLPAASSYDPDGKPLLSWRVHALPFLGENQLYQQFHLDEPWNSEHNLKLLDRMPDVFKNPQLDLGHKTTYLAVTGTGTIFEGDQGIHLERILDGVTYTVMLVEVDADQAIPWTQPSDWEFDPSEPLRGLGGSWPDGFRVAFGDAHVQVISPMIDVATWKAMLTKDAGD